jgi:hypothetical protein
LTTTTTRRHSEAPAFEPLESRRLLAATVAALTLADRRELLADWTGPIAIKLRNRLNDGDTSAFDFRLLEYVRNRAGPSFFWDPHDVPACVSFIKDELSAQAASTIDLADQVIDGYFPEQTTSDPYTVKLPRDFSWSRQPAGTDNPEFLHSLNRQGYWLNLALAARFTGRGAYTDEIVRQLDSWSAQQHPPKDPNDWPDAGAGWGLLNTAYRVDNWLWTYFTVVDTPAWTPQANTLFLHRLLLHADFLDRVEPRDAASNWTVTHARSLLSIGLAFPEFARSSRWQTDGRELLFDAINANFRADGGHVEQSPDYHGSTVADLLEPYLLDRLTGHAWPAGPDDLIRNAADAYYQLLQPDGTQPALSDSYRDSGLRLVSRAGTILGDDRWPQSRPRLHDVFLLGPDALDDAVNASDAPALAGRGAAYALADSGYYLMRSGEDTNARQLVFDAGPKGGTHGHLDLLNLELFGYGRTLVADPGPYRYDSSADRKWVISTPAHNTISIDGKSHAAIEKPRDRIIVDDWSAAGDSVLVTAHHRGYADLKGSPVVGRTVWFDRDDTFLVIDYGSASSTHTFTSSFTLPTLDVTRFRGGRIRSTTGHGDVMLQPLLLEGQSVATERRFTSSHAPPDERDPAERVTISQTGRSALIATLMVAYTGATPPDVSARWLRYPSATRSGRIEITRAGVSRVIYVDRPPLEATATTSARSVARSAIAPATAIARALPNTPGSLFARTARRVWVTD